MIRILRFLRRYAARYLHWYAAGALALLFTNWVAVTVPLYLADGIDALEQGRAHEVPGIAVTVMALGVLVIAVRTASRLLFFTPGRLVEAEVKRDLFATLMRHQPTFVRRWPPADVISRASSDVNHIRLLSGFGILQVVNTTAAVALTGVQMVRISPDLAALVLLPVVVGLLLTQVFIRRMFTLVRRLQRRLAALGDHILASYRGVASVQAFNAHDAFVHEFSSRNDAYLRTALERANIRTAIGPLLALAGSVNAFLLLYYGGPMVIEGEITIGELVAFTTLIAYLVQPLRSVSFLLAIVKEAESSVERAEEILAPEPERPDLPNPLAAPGAPPAVSIRGLTFGYPGMPAVLHDVEVGVPAGGTLGVVGPTGAGKSTLLSCLARLYNPPEGTVFVDGEDIRRIDLDGWRRTMTLVPQRAYLFSESLQDNVLLSSPSDGRLERALAAAALEVDVAALPDGVATQVGEAGLTLSGGQRQRVALARALVRDKSVLLLDDVLSAVDHATERDLIGTLREEEGATTVIVAHRLSAVQHADVILVLEEGRVTATGTHAELVQRPGFYQQTWYRQADLHAEETA